jgi:hypothetical protein
MRLRISYLGERLCAAYVAVLIVRFFVGSWSRAFAIRAALWVFIAGGIVLTIFGYLCVKASMRRDPLDFLGEDGEMRTPFAIRAYTWLAGIVLVAGSAFILFEIFFR